MAKYEYDCACPHCICRAGVSDEGAICGACRYGWHADALEGVTPAANETARAAKSAADSAAFEAAEKLYGENERINDKLSNE